jgi:hypothetical protein
MTKLVVGPPFRWNGPSIEVAGVSHKAISGQLRTIHEFPADLRLLPAIR